jgi:hypothetical protein
MKEALLSIGSFRWHPKNSCKMKEKYISNFIAHLLRLVWYLYVAIGTSADYLYASKCSATSFFKACI